MAALSRLASGPYLGVRLGPAFFRTLLASDRKDSMARSQIPDPLTRRHLVERELPPAQALQIAEAYLAEGRRGEAVDFLRKAGAADRLEALRGEAIAEGDVFLLRQIADATAQPIGRNEWHAVARGAESAGKERYAAEARRQADRGEN
jgi:hypothetical protein